LAQLLRSSRSAGCLVTKDVMDRACVNGPVYPRIQGLQIGGKNPGLNPGGQVGKTAAEGAKQSRGLAFLFTDLDAFLASIYVFST
ncbi:MAG: hypothetical protein HQL63_06440, partial [Magnetococcales bacterium]|nr:hypothetical protein [Magnetococcales bacterium]